MVEIGAVIGGRFRVERVLGAGGMGVVVAATHLELGHRVAVKLLRDELARDATIVERFLREARSGAQLRTEHVCRVFDVGRTETGAPFAVMELLEGIDLEQLVSERPLPPALAVDYVAQACVAVAEAHAAGIIHRDLKPSNLFLTKRPNGQPILKVLDFGIAKVVDASVHLTYTHAMLGSPGYMAPEQIESARGVDTRADLWALGATLYQLVSAQLPFYRSNVTEMCVRIMLEPPDPIDVAPALRAVILRCLEKSPAQRYPDVAALVAALAPLGGPMARDAAAQVRELARGWAATRPAGEVSSIAPTLGIGTSALGLTPVRGGDAARASLAPDGAPDDDLDLPGGRRQRPWPWIAATAGALAIAIVAVVSASRQPEASKAAPAPAVAAAPAMTPDAGVPPEAPDAGEAHDAASDEPAPAPPSGERRRPTRSTPAQPAKTSGGSSDGGKSQPIVRTLAKTAREAKDSCLESAADTPWNTAMCWCTKKNRARAKAAFAKLSGFKRATVRNYCAVRGVEL
ncbi:MAG: protein kinase [Kofleriaceae bacterium]